MDRDDDEFVDSLDGLGLELHDEGLSDEDVAGIIEHSGFLQDKIVRFLVCFQVIPKLCNLIF